MSGVRRAVLTAMPVLMTIAVAVVFLPVVQRADAGPDEPAAVPRPIPPTMLEGYAEGQVVALEYLQTYYCPTTPSSDLEPPFGRGDGHPQYEDSDEYQVPPCVVGDTGTGFKDRHDSPGLGVGLSIIATVTDRLRIVSSPSGGTQIHMAFPCPNGA